MSAFLYIFLGSFILFVLGLNHLAYDKFGFRMMRVLFIILGGVMTYGGVVSWTGLAIWNVPFENKALFQISMAFADLLSAVFMFALAFGNDEK